MRELLAGRVRGLEHVGSTSVPGIRAKPILDLMLGLPTLDDGTAVAPELAKLGYEFRPDAGLAQEHVFAKGVPRTHILHVVEFGGRPWRQKLLFRDALRAEPDLARAYEELKIALAVKFPKDRAAYTAGKSEFVLRVLNRVSRGPAAPRSTAQ